MDLFENKVTVVEVAVKESTEDSTEEESTEEDSTEEESTEEESTEEELTEESTEEEETVMESKKNIVSPEKESKEKTVSSDVAEVKDETEGKNQVGKTKSKWWRKRKSIDVFQMSDDDDDTIEIKRTRKDANLKSETSSEGLESEEPTESTMEEGIMPELRTVMMKSVEAIEGKRNEELDESAMEVDESNTEFSSKLADANEMDEKDNSSLEELKFEPEASVKASTETSTEPSQVLNPTVTAVANDSKNKEDSINASSRTEKVTFNCDLCGKSYGTKGSLQTHKYIKHTKKVKDEMVKAEAKKSTESINLLHKSDAEEEVKIAKHVEDTQETLKEEVKAAVLRKSEADETPTSMEQGESNTEPTNLGIEDEKKFDDVVDGKEMEMIKAATEPSKQDCALALVVNNSKNEMDGSNVPTEAFKCDVCGKPYTKKASMRTHRYKHTKEERERAVNAATKESKEEKPPLSNSMMMETENNMLKLDDLTTLKEVVEKEEDIGNKSVESVQTLDCAVVPVENSHETLGSDECITSEQPAQDGSNESFKCNHCGKECESKESLRLHVYIKHVRMEEFAKVVSMDVQNKELPTLPRKEPEIDTKEDKENVSNIVENSKKSSSPSPWFTCSICSSMHFGKDGLEKHMSHNHPGQKAKPMCSKCNQTFARNETLKKHMEKKHKTKEIPLKEPSMIDSDTEMKVDEADSEMEKDVDISTEQVVITATEEQEIPVESKTAQNEKIKEITVSEDQIATEIEKLEAKEAENLEKLSKIATEMDKLKSKGEKPKSKWWKKGKGIDIVDLQEVRKEMKETKSSTQKILKEENNKDVDLTRSEPSNIKSNLCEVSSSEDTFSKRKEVQEESTENLDEEFDEVVEDEFEEEDIDSHLEAAKLRLVHSDEKDVEQVAKLTEDAQKSMVEPKETKEETKESPETSKKCKVNTKKSKVEAKDIQKETKVYAIKSKVDTKKSKVETNETNVETKASMSNTKKIKVDTKKSKIAAKDLKVETNATKTETKKTAVETKVKAEVKRLRRSNMSVGETVDPKKMGRPGKVAPQVKKKSVL